jgi:parvulin-like peptidyl-prolyl isomerase
MPAFVRGSAPPPVEAALLAMKPGETTGAIETATGFEILLLHERIEGRGATLDEVKPRVIDALQRKAGQDRLQALVNSLRAKARIETYI